MLGAAISAESFSFWTIFIGRGMIGTAFGFILTAVPVYVSEAAPDKHRGKLVVLFEFFLSVASCGAYVGALALQELLVEDDDNPDTPKGWRIMAGSVGLPGAILLLVCTRIPESSRWHVMRGEYDEARESLVILRGDSNEAGEELSAMIDGYARTPQMTGYGQLLFAPDLAARRAMLIGTVLSALYAFVHLQFHYSPTVLLHAGFDVSEMLYLQVANQAARILFSGVAVSIIDVNGRRPVLFGVFFFAGTGFALLSLGFIAKIGWLCATGITSVYLGRAIQPRGVEVELFPLGLRAVGKGWTSGILKLCQALSVGTTLFWVDMIGWGGVFGIQAVLGFFGIIFVYKTLPETKNKSLEVIEKQLRLGTIETPPTTPINQLTPESTSKARDNDGIGMGRVNR